jgi:lysylphosphatidylglycerol synthetase-like protein (DUF2156 family)
MPLFDLFITMLWFFLFVAWIWLLISVYADVFRSEDLGGGAKAAWVIFVLVLPYVGVFVYLIARGGEMQDRAAQQAREAQRAAEARIREIASHPSPADELAKLATLRDQGALTSEEFDSQKVKLLA